MPNTLSTNFLTFNRTDKEKIVSFTISDTISSDKKYYVKVRNADHYVLEKVLKNEGTRLTTLSATFTNLASGQYGVEVWAEDNNGAISYPDNGFQDLLLTENAVNFSGKIIAKLSDDQNINKTWENTLTLKGESAYESALKNGFTGSEKEWIDSLQNGTNVYQENIGDGNLKEFVIFHKLNSNNVLTMVRRNSAPYDVVLPDIEIRDSDNIVIKFGEPPLAKEFSVMVIGPNFISRDTRGSSSSKWEGIKGCFIGDSITEVNFRANKGYVANIRERTGIETVNLGTSGYGYQTRVGIYSEVPSDSDFITVFLGTNDWGNVSNFNLPLGKVTDLTEKTVLGCVRIVLKQLTDRWVTTPIGVITPLPRIESYGHYATPNAAGYTLEQLVEGIIEIAKDFSLPVLDLYHESNLYVYNRFEKERVFTFSGKAEDADGLHPNDTGHRMMSYKIQNFIEQKLLSGKITPINYVYSYDKEKEEYMQWVYASLNNNSYSLVLDMGTWKYLFDHDISGFEVNGHRFSAPHGSASGYPYWWLNNLNAEEKEGVASLENISRTTSETKYMTQWVKVFYRKE